MTRKLVQQVRSLHHVAGPGGWRWVLLSDVADVIGMSAPELLRRFVDTGPTLGVWAEADSVYITLSPTADGILIELPSGDVADIGYDADEIGEFLEIVGPVRVPLGWALEVAQLVKQGYVMTNTTEYINYNSVDELPQQDLLWIRTLDLGAGHFRVGYAARAPRDGGD